MLTHVRFSVIPPEVLMDRRRRLREGVRLPKGKVSLPERGRWRAWPGMIASGVFHLAMFTAATGLMRGASGPEQNPNTSASDDGREVSMVYLEPPPLPTPEPEVQQTPPPPPPQVTTPPSQQELPPPGPESDEILSPAPAPETDPETLDLAAADERATNQGEAALGEEEDPNTISTDPLDRQGPEERAGTDAASSSDRTQEQEARRLFGRPTTGTGTRNNALPWASDSTCIPDPTPVDRSGPTVLDSISGQVFDRRGMPLSGAHLQVVGTSYHTFSDGGGRYTLVFDVGLVANCRVQVVRVSAEGFRGRDLYLAMGLGDNNVYMER